MAQRLSEARFHRVMEQIIAFGLGILLFMLVSMLLWWLLDVPGR